MGTIAKNDASESPTRSKLLTDAVQASARLSRLTRDELMEAYHSAPPDGGDVLLALAQVAAQREARRRLARTMANEPQSVTPAVAAATQATENAWRQMDEDFGLLTSVQVSELLSPRCGVNRKLVNDMRARGEILGTRRRNAFRYPAFQFDNARRSVRPWVKRLVGLAKSYGLDHEEVILWLVRPTTYLGTYPDGTAQRPVDAADDDCRIVDVAEKAWSSRW